MDASYIKQLVIEDVPHQFQGRILDYLKSISTGRYDRDKKELLVGDKIKDGGSIYTIVKVGDNFYKKCDSGLYAFQNTQHCKKLWINFSI